MPSPTRPPEDALYDLAPAEFVAARNALAKQLKAAGDKAEAARVTALRRPTPVAHGLNRVARHQATILTAAFDAGAALQAASDAAVGGDAAGLREATAADREALKALTAAVAEVLGAKAADLAQKVTATVRAAMSDPAVADELRSGRMDVELESSGFELVPGTSGGAPAARPTDDLAERRAARQAKVDKAAREEAQREAEERRAKVRREVAHQRQLSKLESRAARLAEVADTAEAAARDARVESDAANAELARVRDAGPEGPS